jgi:hypothetical protein
VDEVPRRRRQRRRKLVGSRFGALRVGPILHQVDVEVRRLRVLGVAAIDRLDQLHGVGDAWVRLLVGGPVIPRTGVHRGLGREQRDIVIAGVRGRRSKHGIGVSGVEPGAVGFRVRRIALEHRGGERLLGRRSLARKPVRIAREAYGAGIGRRVHRRESFAPKAHRARGIEPLRFAERCDRGGMVEAIGKAEALVEITLRARVRGGDREMHLAEPVIQRSGRGNGRLADDRGGERDVRAHRSCAVLAAAESSHTRRRVEEGKELGGKLRRRAVAHQRAGGAGERQGTHETVHRGLHESASRQS